MKINIEVTSWFKRFTGNKTSIELEVVQGTLAFDAISSLGIPREEIGFVALVSTNTHESKLIDDKYILTEGDTIKVFPWVIGG